MIREYTNEEKKILIEGLILSELSDNELEENNDKKEKIKN
jgi:hypothetical protein